MVKRSCHRVTIIQLHCRGLSAREIHRRLGVHRSVIYRTIKRYKDLGTEADRPGRGRPAFVVTTDNIKKKTLLKAWEELDLTYLRAAVDDFPMRLKACIEANGDIFEP
ncbi:hypothetical protein Q1695_003372 [Nippostrongylus brasiliensis]|nr:hypothetical protein Q1695_003372 [Nippostrongylus brasiliensis]